MSKKRNKMKAEIGDVFAISLDKFSYGYGQVVGEGNPRTYIIFDLISNNHPEINNILSSPIAFIANTVDVPIEDGDWIVIGNMQIPKELHLPFYKMNTQEGYYLTSSSGEMIRLATPEEIEMLENRKSISPSILEDAIKAKYGFGEWYQYLDNLIYKG